MKFKDSLSYKCFKSACLWSLLCDLIVIGIFLIGYILTVLITLISQDNNIGQGVGWLIIVVPTIFAKIMSMILFAIANGFFAFTLYLEYVKKEQNLPLFIIEKTEQIFNNIIKKDLTKKIIFIISILSFSINTFIAVTTFYAIFIVLISFVLFFIINKIKN